MIANIKRRKPIIISKRVSKMRRFVKICSLIGIVFIGSIILILYFMSDKDLNSLELIDYSKSYPRYLHEEEVVEIILTPEE